MTEEKSGRRPSIRFKGFTDPWEQRKLGDLGKVLTGNTPPTADLQNWASGTNGYVWITPSDITSVMTDDSEKHLSEQGWSKARVVPKNSVLITSIASIGKNTINTISAAFNQQINAIVPLNNDAYFILSSMIRDSRKFESLAGKTATSIINKTQFQSFKIFVPEFDEQQQIGSFIKSLDNTIALHQRKQNLLRKLKQGYLQELFPKDGQKVPELRFPGFADDWEQRKLSDVSTRVRGNDGRMNLPTLTISAGSGWLDQKERFSQNIAGNEQKNYTLLHKGQLSYNHGNSKLAQFGAVFELQNYSEALVPRVYHSFDVGEKADPKFIEQMFATHRPDRELRKLVSSGARMDGLLNINYDAFINIKVMLPSLSEQKAISELLTKLDDTIALHQQQLDNLKQVKKWALQNLFV